MPLQTDRERERERERDGNNEAKIYAPAHSITIITHENDTGEPRDFI
jgi:hypothetical protein